MSDHNSHKSSVIKGGSTLIMSSCTQSLPGALLVFVLRMLDLISFFIQPEVEKVFIWNYSWVWSWKLPINFLKANRLRTSPLNNWELFRLFLLLLSFLIDLAKLIFENCSNWASVLLINLLLRFLFSLGRIFFLLPTALSLLSDWICGLFFWLCSFLSTLFSGRYSNVDSLSPVFYPWCSSQFWWWILLPPYKHLRIPHPSFVSLFLLVRACVLYRILLCPPIYFY